MSIGEARNSKDHMLKAETLEKPKSVMRWDLQAEAHCHSLILIVTASAEP